MHKERPNGMVRPAPKTASNKNWGRVFLCAQILSYKKWKEAIFTMPSL